MRGSLLGIGTDMGVPRMAFFFLSIVKIFTNAIQVDRFEFQQHSRGYMV